MNWYRILNRARFGRKNEMSNENLQAKLEQAKIDRDRIEDEVISLEAKIKDQAEQEMKLGDIVINKHRPALRRVILYNKNGELGVFCLGCMGWLYHTSSNLSYYEKTGENIISMCTITK